MSIFAGVLLSFGIFLFVYVTKTQAQCPPGYSCYPSVTVDLFECNFYGGSCHWEAYNTNNNEICSDQVACSTGGGICSSNDEGLCRPLRDTYNAVIGCTSPTNSQCSSAYCCEAGALPSPTSRVFRFSTSATRSMNM